MHFILFGLGITVIFFLNIALFHKAEIIENTILAMVEYFCVYISVSGILFWIDMFDIILAEMLTLGIECILLELFRKRVKFSKIYWDWKKNLTPVFICMIALPFIWNKFEFFGMGQDEGVYQTQAIAFLNGETTNLHELGAYDYVPEEEKEGYAMALQKALMGFYQYDETLPTLKQLDREEYISGYYHGIPTFPALLALWGSMAGIGHMMGVQTILFICAVFLLFYIGENLRLDREYQRIGTLTFALSPIVIWVCKSALTEMMLVCFMLTWVYFLTEKPRSKMIIASAVPLVSFSFFHITIYTIIPVVVLVYFILYLRQNQTAYLCANIVILGAFMAGISMMVHVAATYCYTYNLTPLYRLCSLIRQENVWQVLLTCSGVGIILNVGLYLFGEKYGQIKLEIKKNKYVTVGLRFIVALLLMMNVQVLAGHIMDFGLLEGLGHNTLLGYGLFTGIILIAYAVFGMIVQTDRIIDTKNHILIGIMFIYFVLIYSSVFRMRISYYYYYGRYLVPFLPCVILAGCLAMSYIKNRRIRKVSLMICLMAVLGMAAAYDSVFLTQKDDTRLSWQVLEECSETVGRDNVVIIDRNLTATLFLPLMHMTDADVYMKYGSILNEQTGCLGWEENKEIYFISDEFYEMPCWEKVYVNRYVKSESNDKAEGLLPLPKTIKKQVCRIYIYRYYPVQLSYLMKDEELLTNGFHEVEGNARWTEGTGSIYCYLESADYELCVRQGTVLPWEELEWDSMNCVLRINGEYAGEYEINAENVSQNLTFQISENMIQDGKNEVVLECDSWCPQEIGREDGRTLGISVKEIEFIKYMEGD